MKNIIVFFLLFSSFCYGSLSIEVIPKSRLSACPPKPSRSRPRLEVVPEDPWHSIRLYMDNHSYFTPEDQFVLINKLSSMNRDDYNEILDISKVAKRAVSEISSSGESTPTTPVTTTTLNEILLLHIKQAHSARMSIIEKDNSVKIASIQSNAIEEKARARLASKKLYLTVVVAAGAAITSIAELVYIIYYK